MTLSYTEGSFCEGHFGMKALYSYDRQNVSSSSEDDGFDLRTASSTVAEATFKKLKDGSWGLLVNSESVRPGDDVLTITKAGKREVKTVGKVVWSGNGVTICTIGDDSSSSRGRPSAPHGRPSPYESDEQLAAKGLIRVKGPRGYYIRRITDRELFDEL